MAILSCSYNVRQIKKNAGKTRERKKTDKIGSVDMGPKEDTKALSLRIPKEIDPDLKEKTEKINSLFEAINSQGNSSLKAKIKFFYLPETQKTLDQYRILYENGIDTPNSKECVELIRENLDKTIKLLTIEYDSAVSEKMLEVRLGGGVIGKMLENNKYAATPETIDKICSASNVTPFDLLLPPTGKDETSIIDSINKKLKLCSNNQLQLIEEMIDLIRQKVK